MAVVKTKELESGYSPEYHRIKSFHFCRVRGHHIAVETYKDSAARFSDKHAVYEKTYTVPNESFDEAEPLFPQLYTYLKTLPEFDGAQDA